MKENELWLDKINLMLNVKESLFCMNRAVCDPNGKGVVMNYAASCILYSTFHFSSGICSYNSDLDYDKYIIYLCQLNSSKLLGYVNLLGVSFLNKVPSQGLLWITNRFYSLCSAFNYPHLKISTFVSFLTTSHVSILLTENSCLFIRMLSWETYPFSWASIYS